MAKKTSIKKQWVGLTIAFLLGFWSWLYSYKIDAWKFWTSIAIGVILLIFEVGILGWALTIWAFLDWCFKKQEFLDQVYGFHGGK